MRAHRSIRAVAIWLLLMAVESVNGTLRTLFLVPLTGEVRARQIGVGVGSACILMIAFLTIRWVGARTPRALLIIGLLWVGLTLVFEFSLGRMLGRSWPDLLSDYDLRAGGLMPIGLVLMAFSPLLAARYRRLH